MGAVVELTDSFNFELVKTHLKELDSDSRRTRFFSTASDHAIDAYVDKINVKKDICFGFFQETKLVGFLHLAYIDDDQYELGVSVSSDYRRYGIAKILMRRAITWCKAHGVTKLIMECLNYNQAMKTLAKQLGMSVVTDADSAVATAALQTTTIERLQEIQKNLMYQNIALIDKSVRSFYADLFWVKPK